MSRVCPSWLSWMLDNPLRKALTDRERILDESCVTAESTVLEVGAGSGFLSEAIVRRAKKVYCVELQSGMVRKLMLKIGDSGEKVQIITADIATAILAEDLADVCLLYYSFHEVENKTGAVANIRRCVKKGGILSIYEPTVEVGRSTMERTVKTFEHAGFERETERATLFTRFARLRKKSETGRHG